MLPRRYTLVLADRGSGVVRRYTVAVRPTLAVGVLTLLTLIVVGLNYRWTTLETIEELRLSNARLNVETTKYRVTAEQTTTQLSLLDAAVADLGRRSPLDRRSRQIIGGLPEPYRTPQIGSYRTSGIQTGKEDRNQPLEKETFDLLHDLLTNLEEHLQVARYSVARREALVEATPSIWPTDGWLSAGYGYRNDPFTGERAFHPAVDISTRKGRPVYATATGRVISASPSGAYGNLVSIEHGFQLKTRYGHLSEFAVNVGDLVARGDVIGLVGETGRATGAHVHYEVWVNGRAMNPKNLLPLRPLQAN